MLILDETAVGLYLIPGDRNDFAGSDVTDEAGAHRRKGAAFGLSLIHIFADIPKVCDEMSEIMNEGVRRYQELHPEFDPSQLIVPEWEETSKR